VLERFALTSAGKARALTRRLFHRPPVGALWLSPWLLGSFHTPAVIAARADAKAMGALEPEVLSGLAMPILVLWGASEKILPYEGIHFFREHLPPHAQIHVVPGFGHIPQTERPAELVDRVVRFADEARSVLSAPPPEPGRRLRERTRKRGAGGR
jgi:pimeloyl-ACP methyl ester carboxylesterase